MFKPGGGSEAKARRASKARLRGLLTNGESGQESAFIDACESGADVFFMTTGKLAPQDSDDAYDVYDAHECTGGSPCIAPPGSSPPACTTADACRSAPTPQPSVFSTPASATFSGPGNPGPAPAAKPKPETAAQIRAAKLAKALKACHRQEKEEAQSVRKAGP